MGRIEMTFLRSVGRARCGGGGVGFTRRLYIHGYCRCFYSLTYVPTTLLSFLPPLCNFSSPFRLPAYPLHLLRRPQAGDDLRLLEDGVAGELLQHRHDHQAGGSGQGNVSALPHPLLTWMDGWMDRGRDGRIELYSRRKIQMSLHLVTKHKNNGSNVHLRQS